MIPAVVTIGVCGLSGLVLSLAFDDVNIMNFGSYLFLKLFGQMGNGLFSMLLYILLSHVLWFFGIHGTNTLEAVSRRLFESEVAANQAMAAQGLVPTHVFSKNVSGYLCVHRRQRMRPVYGSGPVSCCREE